jgi:cytochrome c peroxidase
MKTKGLLITSGIFLISAIILYSISCKDDTTSTTNTLNTTPYKFPTPKYFPEIMNIPADNPTTVEGVKLGRYLYYDGRISGRTDCDSQMACATCHIQAHSFECGIDNEKYIGGRTFGVTGIPTPHVMLPHVNLVYNFNGYEWNGFINNNNTDLGSAEWNVPAKPDYNFRNLEAEFWTVLYLHNEMYSDSTKCIAALKSIKHPDYPALFKAAFGTTDITIDRCSKAVGQFVRTLISYNSKFDKYMRKEAGGTLTASELRGYQLFISEPADCFHCHGPAPLFTTNLFYNNAKAVIFDESDRYGYTHDTMDKAVYKASTLRNIELTGPYMHDGRFKTLEEVVNFYATGLVPSASVSPLMKHLSTGGNQLTDQQQQDLVAFLKTLTDYIFISDTAFAWPSDLNTGCPH